MAGRIIHDCKAKTAGKKILIIDDAWMLIYSFSDMPEPVMQNLFPVFPQFDGIFVLNKSSGPSSAGSLRIFKRLGQKKVGHAGTLDPMASGVLLVLLGQATKLTPYLQTGGEKTYSGTIRLGLETDTWDILGKTVSEKPIVNIREEDIILEARNWLNITEQEVPPYSAAKHNGVPLYKLARKGVETPKKIKKIQISRADISEIDMPFVHFRVSCSSGSYIRSLAHSLGKRLGCGAVLVELTREYSHPFGLDQSTNPDELREMPDLLPERLLPVWHGLPGWKRIEIEPSNVPKVKNGNPIPAASCQDRHALLCHNNEALALAALGEGDAEGMWTVLRGLWK